MALNDYIMEKPVIETNRLIIREMTSEDIPALKQWLADKAVYTYWGKAARRLARYLDSGLWLKDYQLDELGLLPKDLKRGVLSQDGLYDLLDEPVVKALLKD